MPVALDYLIASLSGGLVVATQSVDGYTDPGIAYVKDGATYYFAGGLLTGTYDPEAFPSPDSSFQELIKAETAGNLVYGELGESITYGGATINAVVDREGTGELFPDDGTVEVAEIGLVITDNTDSVNYPGDASPEIDDAAIVNSVTYRVTDVKGGDLDGLWRLRAERADLKRVSARDGHRLRRNG